MSQILGSSLLSYCRDAVIIQCQKLCLVIVLPEAIEWRWRCSSAVQGIYETELYIDGTDH
jgi:hypothetical protein